MKMPLHSSHHTTEHSIVGGAEIPPLSRPYLVALEFEDQSRCAASLISTRAVMTAAHCLFSKTNKTHWDPPQRVVFNRHNWSDTFGETALNLTNTSQVGGDVVYHPNFTEVGRGFDVAILFLPREMNENPPITLNLDPNVPAAQDDPLEVTGWGYDKVGGPASDVPLSVNLKYVTNRACTIPPFKWPNSVITADTLCAFAPGNATCDGDSGGPLVLARPEGGPLEPFLQVGIIVFGGPGCSNPLRPTVFTRVSSVASWVMQTVCDHVEELCPAPTASPSPSVTTIDMTVLLELEWDVTYGGYVPSTELHARAKMIEEAVFTGMNSRVWEQNLLYVNVMELCSIKVQYLPPIAWSLSQLLPVVETTSIEMIIGISQTCDNCEEEMFNSSFLVLEAIVDNGVLDENIISLSNGTIQSVITNITNASFTVFTSSPTLSPSLSPSTAPIFPQNTTIEVDTYLLWENYTCEGKTNMTIDLHSSSVIEATLAGVDPKLPNEQILSISTVICDHKSQGAKGKRLLQEVNATIEVIMVVSQACDNCEKQIFNATVFALETIISDGTLNTYIQSLSNGTIDAMTVITSITNASYTVLTSSSSESPSSSPSTAQTSETPVAPPPISSAPVSLTPITAAPMFSVPTSQAPVTTTPNSLAPVLLSPITAAPLSAPPTSEAPVPPSPVSSAPMSLAPITAAPLSSAPTSQSLVTSLPISPAPVTLAPITVPMSVSPTSLSPVSLAPISAAPMSLAPITVAPLSAVPPSQAPMTSLPISPAPLSLVPITAAPMSASPTSQAPVSLAPISSAPVSLAPITVAPLPIAPPSQAPITSLPISPAPLSLVPITVAPMSASPTSLAPLSLAPMSSAPVSLAPMSSAPVSLAPMSSTPVSLAPMSSAPVSLAPISSTPVSLAPIILAPSSSVPSPGTHSPNQKVTPKPLSAKATKASKS
ncbi:hypothetical protein ACHAW6_003226 [Cyclotella cf. meneghiniana]